MTIERPTFDESMAPALCEYIKKVLREWSGNPNDYVNEERLLGIAENYNGENGYELAQELESKLYIRPDSILVDLLDNVYHEADLLEKEMVRRWVKDNNLTLELSVGQRVIMDRGRHEEKEGTIVKLYSDELKYGVRTDDQKETAHYIVKSEHVEIV